MTKKTSLLMLMLLLALVTAKAQSDEEVVKSIKDDIQAVKDQVRETRTLLRDQERELRKLNTELERTRNTIQQNKERSRAAKKNGKSFTPKPVERTYTSVYAHPEPKVVTVEPVKSVTKAEGVKKAETDAKSVKGVTKAEPVKKVETKAEDLSETQPRATARRTTPRGNAHKPKQKPK